MTVSLLKVPKSVLLIILLITACTSFAQTNGIVLERKKNQKEIFIEENKRVKITTVDGKRIVGKFSIIDDNTIQIKNTTIELDSITTIQKRSTFASIVRPIIIINGVALVIIGIAGAVSGGYGYLLTVTMIPIGTPMMLLDVFFNKHKSEKWNYRIEQKE